MSFKDRVQASGVVFFLASVVTAFASGAGAVKFVQDLFGLELVHGFEIRKLRSDLEQSKQSVAKRESGFSPCQQDLEQSKETVRILEAKLARCEQSSSGHKPPVEPVPHNRSHQNPNHHHQSSRPESMGLPLRLKECALKSDSSVTCIFDITPKQRDLNGLTLYAGHTVGGRSFISVGGQHPAATATLEKKSGTGWQHIGFAAKDDTVASALRLQNIHGNPTLLKALSIRYRVEKAYDQIVFRDIPLVKR